MSEAVKRNGFSPTTKWIVGGLCTAIAAMGVYIVTLHKAYMTESRTQTVEMTRALLLNTDALQRLEDVVKEDIAVGQSQTLATEKLIQVVSITNREMAKDAD